MKVEGLQQMAPAAGMAGAGKGEAAVERQIQALQRDLNRLEQKQELTGEEQKEKQKLEKQIDSLKRQLLQMQTQEKKETDGEKAAQSPLKEEGKGAAVDAFV